MKSFSFAQIGGVLGRDPESRITPNGVRVTTFSVAVDKGYGDKKSTSWFNIVAFDKAAEFAEKYLKKGKPVIVSGDLQVRTWDDKNTGQKRTSTEIAAFKVDFGEGGGSSTTGDRPARQDRAPAPRQQAEQAPRAVTPEFNEPDDDSGIPF